MPFTARDAYRTGKLLATAGTLDLVDAAVVLAAIGRTVAIMTSDSSDLCHLAEAFGIHLEIISV